MWAIYRPERIAIVTLLGLLALIGTASAQPPVPLDDRINGAEHVVVATARSVAAEWRQNQFGDRLIVSRVQLEVSEGLKGAASQIMWLELDGGTLDGYTLHVSSLPLMQAGDRAVFFLEASDRGVHTAHLGGQGILFLDTDDRLRGSSLRLGDVRNRARSLRQRGGQ